MSKQNPRNKNRDSSIVTIKKKFQKVSSRRNNHRDHMVVVESNGSIVNILGITSFGILLDGRFEQYPDLVAKILVVYFVRILVWFEFIQ